MSLISNTHDTLPEKSVVPSYPKLSDYLTLNKLAEINAILANNRKYMGKTYHPLVDDCLNSIHAYIRDWDEASAAFDKYISQTNNLD